MGKCNPKYHHDTLNPIVKYNNEYRTFEEVPFLGSSLWIRSFDNNMTQPKELNKFKMLTDDNIFGLSHLDTAVNYDENNIYAFTYMYNLGKDTSKHRHLFRKFDMNGKIKLQKDVSSVVNPPHCMRTAYIERKQLDKLLKIEEDNFISSRKVNIYPDPSSDLMTIDVGNIGNYEINIFSAEGKNIIKR